MRLVKPGRADGSFMARKIPRKALKNSVGTCPTPILIHAPAWALQRPLCRGTVSSPLQEENRYAKAPQIFLAD
jgi:hypothetical protein